MSRRHTYEYILKTNTIIMETTQIGDNGWTEYKTKKLRVTVHPDAPLQCNYEIKGNTHSHCTCFPRFFCEEKNLWRCGKHKTSNKRKYIEKDTLKKRESSIRYSTSMTLTRAFITDEQLDAYVTDTDNIEECVYCGADVSNNQIDHIYPIIKKGRPSRYITESPLNKVPCCQSCNSSKSNEEVLDWMVKKKCSQERIDKIKRRMEKVPEWDEKKYQLMNKKFDMAMKLQEYARTICENKVRDDDELQKEVNDVLTKIKITTELPEFTSTS